MGAQTQEDNKYFCMFISCMAGVGNTDGRLADRFEHIFFIQKYFFFTCRIVFTET